MNDETFSMILAIHFRCVSFPLAALSKGALVGSFEALSTRLV